MKTKQELLDFYGVEIGKKYRITKTADGIENSFKGEVFRILENTESQDGVEVVFYTYGHPLAVLNFLDYEEYKSILDDKEREYLQHYVINNPAFKGKVKYITKSSYYDYGKNKVEFLYLRLYEEQYERFVSLPPFKEKSMYKNMEKNKHYTPQELNLEE